MSRVDPNLNQHRPTTVAMETLTLDDDVTADESTARSIRPRHEHNKKGLHATESLSVALPCSNITTSLTSISILL